MPPSGTVDGTPAPEAAPTPTNAVILAPASQVVVGGAHSPGNGSPGGSHPGSVSLGRPNPQNGQNGNERGSPCTAPQLRRFIKSRPYVPMHELRRRFAIVGDDDDVSPIQLDPGCIFIGLPAREGQLLGELLRAGEIGYELSLDPTTPIVVGVYPMRPVPRP